MTWTGDLRTIDQATNPGLAINSVARSACCTSGSMTPAGGNRCETHLETTDDGFAPASTDS